MRLARHRRRRDARPRRRRGARRGSATRCAPPTRAELDITDAAARRDARARRAAPDAVVNCAAYTDVDGAEADEAARRRGQRRPARATSRAAAAQAGASVVHVSTDYVFDGSKREPYVESDADRRRSAPTAHEARRRAARSPAAGADARDRAHRLAVRRRRHELRRHDARARRRARRGRGRRPTRSAARRGPGTSPPRWSSSPSARTRPASTTSRAAGRARGTSSRSRSSTGPGVDCRVLPDDERRVPAARAAARRTACSAPSAHDPLVLPPWQEGVAGYLATRVTRMKLLVCGGAGFIGSNFVRLRAARPRRRGRRARQAHLRRAAREPRGPRHRRSSTPRSRTPAAVARGDRRRRRGRELRRRDARRPLDRRARRVRPRRTRVGTCVLLEAARAARRALPAGLDRRGLRLDRGGLVHRGARRSRRRRPTARRRPAPTCSSSSYFHTYGLRDGHLPRLEQLRARTSTPRSSSR